MLRQSDEAIILDTHFRLPLGENGQNSQASHEVEVLKTFGLKPNAIGSQAHEELDSRPSTAALHAILLSIDYSSTTF